MAAKIAIFASIIGCARIACIVLTRDGIKIARICRIQINANFVMRVWIAKNVIIVIFVRTARGVANASFLMI